MNLTNYHSHCSFCDGRAPLEEFIQEAIRQGFTSYGVSSHAPLPFPTSWTLKLNEVEAYLKEAYTLKEKYASQMEFYVGMEIDYLNEESNPCMPYFRELPLDYRIGSVHLLYDEQGEVVDIDTGNEAFRQLLCKHFNGDLKTTVTAYFDKLMCMVESGGFDWVGHADKISCNAAYCQPGVLSESWYGAKIREYFGLIAERGVMVEINTKAYANSGFFFPNRCHFKLLKDLRIPLLVNSDAHAPNLVNQGRTEALQALRQEGINKVMELKRGCWEEVGIGSL